MTNASTAFIAVFRPHQRPAWAEVYQSEDDFVRDWANGYFSRSCFAEPKGDDTIDFATAWQDAGHDLNSLTRLDSPEEVARYLTDYGYAGHHNKGRGDVRRCAEELGWIEVDESDED